MFLFISDFDIEESDYDVRDNMADIQYGGQYREERFKKLYSQYYFNMSMQVFDIADFVHAIEQKSRVSL